MEKKDLSNIAGLLGYGVFVGDSFKKILALYISIAVLCLFAGGAGIASICDDQIRDPSSFASFVITIVIIVLIILLFLVFLLILVLKNERMRKEVLKWMEDAVLVQADSKKYGYKFPGVKLQVDFEIDGVHYRRYSESRRAKSINEKQGGYYLIWTKYADRKINILYSKRYDQVIVLKS